jgi:adenosine deaminase
VTLNAYDEFWFGESVVGQYRVAREHWAMSDLDLAEVAGSGLLVAGMSDATRRRYRDALAAWLSDGQADTRSPLNTEGTP